MSILVLLYSYHKITLVKQAERNNYQSDLHIWIFHKFKNGAAISEIITIYI